MPKTNAEKAEYMRNWRKNNPDKASQHNESLKAYLRIHPQKRIPKEATLRQRLLRQTNPEKARASDAARKARYFAKNPLAKAKKNMRQRIYQVTRRLSLGKLSGKSSMHGCSKEYLKFHFEQLFQPGMSWANYGLWHVDHIVPLSSAKTLETVLILCHYTNLQPLWAIDNILKGSKTP